MKRILKVGSLLCLTLLLGVCVGCKSETQQSCADNFKFAFVSESATKVTDETNHNITISLDVENLKEAENTLTASKFVLKQSGSKVNTASSFGDLENSKTAETFESLAKKEVVLNLTTLKSVSGECVLYYGDVQLFTVKI